ncbi:hypothetical protein [Devosia sp.]|uniref:hypothetical protein n=1 Tax=Devosia sp. TaxID=1871048 RepID=UPI002FC984C7
MQRLFLSNASGIGTIGNELSEHILMNTKKSPSAWSRIHEFMMGYPNDPWSAAKRISDYAGIITRLAFVIIALLWLVPRFRELFSDIAPIWWRGLGAAVVTYLVLLTLALSYSLAIVHAATLKACLPEPMTSWAKGLKSGICFLLATLTVLPFGMIAIIQASISLAGP